MMDINEIRAKYNNGDYTYKVGIPKKLPVDYVFDEELSVKRNRELVQEHNDKADLMRKDKNRIQRELDKRFTYDVVVYIMENYGLTESQAKTVENFVYQEHHSFMSDYFSYIDTFADFASNLVSPEEVEE